MKLGIAFDHKDKETLSRLPYLIDVLRKNGHEVALEHALKRPRGLKATQVKKMAVDALIALGDNFNIVRSFKETAEKQTPVLGVSVGAKGFLSEIKIEQFELAAEKLSKGEFFIERMSRLKVMVDGKEQQPVLNDVVIVSKSSSTICSYSLYVDDNPLFKDSGDGLIIATPNGSTAYSVSAGGPIVLSRARAISLTPICSLGNNKPVVVDENSMLKIKSIYSPSGCTAVLDGRFRSDIKSGEVNIEISEHPAFFIRIPGLTIDVINKLKRRSDSGLEITKSAPPSAKFIIRMLQYEGGMTQKEIIKLTSLPSRTVRSALKYLSDNGIIQQQTSLRDARYTIYSLKTP